MSLRMELPIWLCAYRDDQGATIHSEDVHGAFVGGRHQVLASQRLLIQQLLQSNSMF